MVKLLRLLMALACLGCLGLLVFAIFWRSPTMAGLTVMGTLAVVPVGLWRLWGWVLRVPWALLTLGLIPVLLGQVIDELNATGEAIQSRYLTEGVASVSVVDKLAVYQLGVWMVVLGGPIFPEVAMEHALLMVPGSGGRTFESDFPMRSRHIAAWVAQFQQGVRVGGPAQAVQRFTWDYTELSEARVALALNAFELSVSASPVEQGWRVEASGEVEISYPQDYDLPLLPWGGRVFVVREGLYRMLEEAGWYHPYTAVWCWEVE